MRALLAGIFVFAMVLVAVIVAGSGSKSGDLPWWETPLILLTFVVCIPAALVVFNMGRRIPKGAQNDTISDLRDKGLLVSKTFQATRAFEVKEIEDEGSHFFIELVDGGVLFLSGQYLYDHRDMKNASTGAATSFPCTEFTLLRHKTDSFVVDIECSGSALTIECEAPPFSERDFGLDAVPEDGQVIRDRSYEEIKKERLANRR